MDDEPDDRANVPGGNWDDTARDQRTQEAVEDVLLALFRSGRVNAIVAWAMVGVLALVLVESALDVDVQWTIFVGAVGVLVCLPPAASRDWRVMLPWELLVVALLPILVRGLFGGEVGLFATYVSVAALALLVVVELHSFTGLRVTHWFAVALVVLTTMAAAAAWAVVRWNLDRYLGTGFLTDNEALMYEFLWVTLAGLVAGMLFDVYFRRRESLARRAIARAVGR